MAKRDRLNFISNDHKTGFEVVVGEEGGVLG